jgi:hypothetical protein
VVLTGGLTVNAFISRSALQQILSSKKNAASGGDAPSATATGRTAVFVVHGISPIQRYAMQDQYADGLLGYLNACETSAGSGKTWTSSIYWPKAPSDKELQPSAISIHLDGAPAAAAARALGTAAPSALPPLASAVEDEAEGPTLDVYEGYWSPYTKNKTNITSLLTWLLNATFLATSSTSQLPARGRKIAWDFGYVIGVLLWAGLFVALAVRAAYVSWHNFQSIYQLAAPAGASTSKSAASGDVPTSLSGLLSAVQSFSWTGWLQIVASLVIGFLVAQLINLVVTRYKTWKRTAELRKDAPSRTGHFQSAANGTFRWQAWTGVGLLILLGLVVSVDARIVHRLDVLECTGLLVVSVLAIQYARSRLDFVVEDVLGDVQVYTTHDCNAEFFEIREKVIADVTNALLGVLEAEPAYDRIHIAGHSLGSTIALDVLMRVRMLVQEGSVTEAQWRRIRSLLTFGAALEKTRFFFDVRNPTVSAAHDQWDADVFGRFFTANDIVLKYPAQVNPGIYWRNIFYQHDIVANEIVTYTTDVPLGFDFSAWSGTAQPRLVCDNGNGPLPHPRPPWAFVHGDYTGDPQFWAIAGALVRQG